MISLGLSAADQRVFEEALLGDYAVNARVSVLDMDQQMVGQVTGGVLSGQVDVDSSQDVERTCTVEVRDPGNHLGLVAADPQSPPVLATRMVRIEHGVRVPRLGRWVWVPLFTGPISKAAMDDGKVTITGKGKESLLGAATSRTTTYKKGSRKTDIIANQIAKQGEEFRQITRWSDKTTSDIVIASTQAPWPVLKQLARELSGSSSNYPWLGYDGRGICVLKSHSQAVRWRFDQAQIMSDPQIDVDTESMCNFVVATPNDTGSKTKLKQATARLAKSDPFSPESLSRGGVPRFVRDEITGDWTSQKQIQAAANARLDSVSRASVTVSMDTLVIPHLEPRDVVRIVTDKWTWDMQLTKFTIPLAASQAMSHGRTVVVRPKAKMRGRVVHR